MKLITAINRIRTSAHDISGEYDRESCINFLNTVIQGAASLLITGNYPKLIRTIILYDGSKMPKNIMKACGTYPIKITEDEVRILEPDVTQINYRYFATPDSIPQDAPDDYELPFTNDAINEAIIRQATVMALNQNEFDTRQDVAQMTAFQQAITAAMAGE